MATLRRLSTGRWQAQVRKKGHSPATRSFRTKSAAQAWARSVEDDMERGEWLGPGTKLTVDELLRWYDDKIVPRKRSQRTARSQIRVLTAGLGPRLLAELTADDIIEWTYERLESGEEGDERRRRQVSPSTVRKDIGLLSHAIRMARALRGIRLRENVAATARDILTARGALTDGEHRDRRLEAGEEDALLEHAPGELPTIIRWVLATAMRRGEVAAIRREHRVRKNLLRVPETKTGRPRTIPLSADAIAIWEALPARIDGRLFGMQPDSITQAFTRACKKAKIDDLRFHDLRHEAISRLFEKGLGIQEVALIAGISDYRTLKRYTHPRPTEIAEKLD